MPWNENVVANCIMVPVTLSESRPKNRKGGVGIPRTAFIYSFVQLVYLEDLVAIKNILPKTITQLWKTFYYHAFLTYPFFAALFGWLLWRLAISNGTVR